MSAPEPSSRMIDDQAAMRLPLPRSKLVVLSLVGVVLAAGGAFALASPALFTGGPTASDGTGATATPPLGHASSSSAQEDFEHGFDDD